MSIRGKVGSIVESIKNDGKELSFEWNISDFFSLSAKVGDWYQSPYIGFSDACWYLKLCPNTDTQNPALGLYLYRKDTGPPKIIIYAIGIRSSDRVEKTMSVEREFSKKIGGFGCSNFCTISELKKYKSRLMPNNMLTITCSLKTIVGSSAREGVLSCHDASIQTDEERREHNFRTVGIQTLDTQGVLSCQDASIQTDEERREQNVRTVGSQALDKQGTEELKESLQRLLAGGEDSDVVIKVRGKEFPAHRAILRARSPVFQAMFSHDMVEKQSGVVNMGDCDPESFPAFLEHVYTGSVEMISTENVFSLYTASDKYDLNTLKKASTEFVKNNLTVSCFCDAITLAVKHGEKQLIECATEFFCSNTLEIFKTVQWEIFLKENTTIGNELLIKAFTK